MECPALIYSFMFVQSFVSNGKLILIQNETCGKGEIRFSVFCFTDALCKGRYCSEFSHCLKMNKRRLEIDKRVQVRVKEQTITLRQELCRGLDREQQGFWFKSLLHTK